MSILELAIATELGLCFIFGLFWWWARKVDNYSLVDAVWSLSFGIVAGVYGLLAEGWPARRIAMATIVAIWSLRLGGFLCRRIYAHHPKEDGRYQELRRGYGRNVPLRFFWFFQMQALSVLILSLPFLFIAQNSEPQFAPIEIAGMVFWFFSMVGEALADRQMQKFKAQPSNRNRTCQQGLWRYSRHPNYFFEACVWFAYYVLALGSPYGVFTLYAPLLILFLLTRVTGVPPSEAQALKSRGDEFREYQRRTSVFVPWFRKEG